MPEHICDDCGSEMNHVAFDQDMTWGNTGYEWVCPNCDD